MSATLVPARPLTANDICDRCGAKAYVRALLGTGELLFCAHHGREHAKALAEVAIDVQDFSNEVPGTRSGG